MTHLDSALRAFLDGRLLHGRLTCWSRRRQYPPGGEYAGWVKRSFDGEHGGNVGLATAEPEPLPLGPADAMFGADAASKLSHQAKRRVGHEFLIRIRNVQDIDMNITLDEMTE